MAWLLPYSESAQRDLLIIDAIGSFRAEPTILCNYVDEGSNCLLWHHGNSNRVVSLGQDCKQGLIESKSTNINRFPRSALEFCS